MNRSVTSFVNASFSISGALLYLVPVTFYLVYADTFNELWHYWNDGQNWQFLIPVAFVYMLWDRRDLLVGLEIKPNILWGSSLLVGSIAILIAGQISYTHSLREISVVVTVFSLVLLLFGTQYIRKLFWPLVYLFLMTSLPTDLLARSSETLKLVSAAVGANMLELFGYAVYREGTVLQLPHITLVVADECSGLNQLMSAIALGIPIAFTMVDKWWKRITILLLSCLFGIMANWLRVFLIAIWHYDSAKQNIHGPNEIYQLPFIFLIGVFFTFLIALALADKEKPEQHSGLQLADGVDGSKAPVGKTRTASLIAIFVLSAAAVYLNTWQVKPVYLEHELSQFPMSIAGFKGSPVKELGKPFYTGLAQEELIASYTNYDGVAVNVFIGYFRSQDAEHELVDYRYNWLHDGARAIDVPAASSSVRMKMNTVETTRGPGTVFFVYEINGKSLVDLKKVKFASLLDALFYQRTNGAIIIAVFDKETEQLSVEEQEFLSSFLTEAQARL
ncbi:MAG: exosortase W [Gammaproteobacteria bacterium]|nr:exosortase W [Gammaproteobacteria bacterium]